MLFPDVNRNYAGTRHAAPATRVLKFSDVHENTKAMVRIIWIWEEMWGIVRKL